MQGGEIHVVVPAAHMSLFDEKLTLGRTYTISNFKVHANVLSFKPSSHKFMLKFTGGTSVGDENEHEILAKPIVCWLPNSTLTIFGLLDQKTGINQAKLKNVSTYEIT